MDLHRQYGHNQQGCLAEYVVHGVKSIFRLPDEMTFSVEPSLIRDRCLVDEILEFVEDLSMFALGKDDD